ncbi:MAG: lytic transglycosylase domain-containing protein [Nanoarchaeota archaeon]
MTKRARLARSAAVAGLSLVAGVGGWNSDPVIVMRIRNSGFDASQYTMGDYLDAIAQIESSGNPRAARYEPHLDDTSYGLGQLLTRTARDLECRHGSLPRLGANVSERLCDPRTNLAYTEAFFSEQLQKYNGDPLLAVAAYNAGPHAPFVAACQTMLNVAVDAGLQRDGSNGPQTEFYLTQFQKSANIQADGKTGPQSWSTLAQAYREKTGRNAPFGEIPRNGMTPRHVLKFKNALEDDVRVLRPEWTNEMD